MIPPIVYLLAAVLWLVLVFAQLRLFSIDRTLKEILRRLPPISEQPIAIPGRPISASEDSPVEAAWEATEEARARRQQDRSVAIIFIALGILLLVVLVLIARG